MLQETGQPFTGQIDYIYIEPRVFTDCESPSEQGEMDRYYTYSVIRPSENVVPEPEGSRCPSIIEFFTSSWGALVGLAREVRGKGKDIPKKN